MEKEKVLKRIPSRRSDKDSSKETKDAALIIRCSSEKRDLLKTITREKGTDISKVISDFIDDYIAKNNTTRILREKLPFSTIIDTMISWNKSQKHTSNPYETKYAIVVLSEDNFAESFDYISRCYLVSSAQPLFRDDMSTKACKCRSLDGNDVVDMSVAVEQYNIEDAFYVWIKQDGSRYALTKEDGSVLTYITEDLL